MNRRQFLKSTGVILGGMSLGTLSRRAPGQAVSQPSPGRPDILFIAIEDVSPQRFGCWGNTVCKTPNFDQFATTALKFDLAHTMAPPCNPSRTSLLLGLRPETTTVLSNNDDWRKKWPTRITMPQHFRESGYEVVRVGKMFHEAFDDGRKSWSRVIEAKQGGSSRKKPSMGPGLKYPGNNPGTVEDAVAAGKGKQPPGAPFVYGPNGPDDDRDHDGLAATAAIEELNTPHGKPLFLAVGLQQTHLPFSAPDNYYAMYKPEDMVVQEDVEEEVRDIPQVGDLADHNDMTLQQKKEAVAAHFAALSYVDKQFGRIMEGLERSGKADNTIVVIWSDHGFLLGEHGQWRKGALYDPGVMVALMMRAPGVTKAGSGCKRPVESVDIFPTLFDLSGIGMPDSALECVSMRPILENPEAEWKVGAVSRNGKNTRSIRTERFRYSEYGNGSSQSELYDHQTDPNEYTNLAKDPAHAQTVAELSKLLNADWKERLPKGLSLPRQALMSAAPASAPAGDTKATSAPAKASGARKRRNARKNAQGDSASE